MAADGYVKAAAAQLHNAAQAVKQEADQMRSELTAYERQASHEVTNKTTTKAGLIGEMNSSSNPAAINAMVQKLDNDINSKKQEMTQKKSDMSQAIKAKEQTASGLTSQARGLEGQAGGLK